MDHIDTTVGTEIPREPADAIAPLRLIAAHHSTDPVLANVEQAIRDALVRIETRAHEDDPLADRFTVERYSGGQADVSGTRVAVGTVDDAPDLILISAQTEIGWRDLRVKRHVAMELRDALDVLIRETRRNLTDAGTACCERRLSEGASRCCDGGAT